MLYIAITPWYIWIAIVAIGWSMLSVLSFARLGIKRPAMFAVLGMLLIQCLSAIVTVTLTHVDAIHPYACLLGAYGAIAMLALVVPQMILVGYLLTEWPRNGDGQRLLVVPWFSIWLMLCLVVYLMHARSAVLCTV
ncbi:MAG: hypothetical protein AAAFM81_05390 [Pseudomonadota bacterium]